MKRYGVFYFLIVCFLGFCTIMAKASCDLHIQEMESMHQIPRHLLNAIAHVESGRTMADKSTIAWPWTINVDGKGYVFDSKQEAISAVKRFQSLGKKSIDIGCMQINLKHHPNAFSSLDVAFDPKHNVSYGARFLVGLKNQMNGDWSKAIAHYHSASPKHHTPYRQKVYQTQRTLLKKEYSKKEPHIYAIWPQLTSSTAHNNRSVATVQDYKRYQPSSRHISSKNIKGTFIPIHLKSQGIALKKQKEHDTSRQVPPARDSRHSGYGASYATVSRRFIPLQLR